MNKKYVWSEKLPADLVERIRARWQEVMGRPHPDGAGLFATVSFNHGTLRVMAMQPDESKVVRSALNQVTQQSELVDLDKEIK